MKRTGGATASAVVGSMLVSHVAAETTFASDSASSGVFVIRAVADTQSEDSSTGPQPLDVTIDGQVQTLSTKTVRRATLTSTGSDSGTSATSEITLAIELVVFYKDGNDWLECHKDLQVPAKGAETYNARFPAGAPKDSRVIATVTKTIRPSNGEITDTTITILEQDPEDQNFDNTYAPDGFGVTVNHTLDEEENIDEVKVVHSGGGPSGNSTPIEAKFEVKRQGE